jgi:hypothetical protein
VRRVGPKWRVEGQVDIYLDSHITNIRASFSLGTNGVVYVHGKRTVLATGTISAFTPDTQTAECTLVTAAGATWTPGTLLRTLTGSNPGAWCWVAKDKTGGVARVSNPGTFNVAVDVYNMNQVSLAPGDTFQVEAQTVVDTITLDCDGEAGISQNKSLVVFTDCDFVRALESGVQPVVFMGCKFRFLESETSGGLSNCCMTGVLIVLRGLRRLLRRREPADRLVRGEDIRAPRRLRHRHHGRRRAGAGWWAVPVERDGLLLQRPDERRHAGRSGSDRAHRPDHERRDGRADHDHVREPESVFRLGRLRRLGARPLQRFELPARARWRLLSGITGGMTSPPALRYERVIALLRREYKARHARFARVGGDELRATLEEMRVVLLFLDGLDAVNGLPELSARHKGERESKVGTKRGDDEENEPRRARPRLVTDATKW